MPDLARLSDEALLDQCQRAAFAYFLENVNEANGLVADTSRQDSPASIAVVGFALSCYPVAVERGWITRKRAADLTLATLRFFHDSAQGRAEDVTGHKGFYYHFLDMQTGKRAWRCELSMVDTALLIAGVLVAQTYFDHPAEAEIRDLADGIYRRTDWAWAQGGTGTLRQGWKPKSGFLRYNWEGYSEALMLFVLALGSPEHAISGACFSAWSATFQWKNIYGTDVLYGGPLFMHQFSHAWINFAGIQDDFMREKRSDYFANSCKATALHREYACRNPHGFAGYGEDLWGLSASDGPGRFRVSVKGRRHSFKGYFARGAPFGPDDGTIAPWSFLASLPFAPEFSLSALRNLLRHYPTVAKGLRMPSGFNPTLAGRRGYGPHGWVSEGHYGLDQGISVMMIENYRSGLIWNLMRSNRHVGAGLHEAGFRGGWLQQAANIARPTPK